MIVGRVQKVLHMIAAGKRMTEIGEFLDMEMNTLDALIDGMVEEGLLEELRSGGCAGCPLRCKAAGEVYGYAITPSGRERMRP